VLYEMLCGAPPLLANALPKLLTLHVTGQVTPLRPRAPGTPPALEQIMLRMLAKSADQVASGCSAARSRRESYLIKCILCK
jgi:hypothetical protein